MRTSGDLELLARVAGEVASDWSLELGPPFARCRHSFVAPAGGDAVLKVTAAGDDESAQEADALARWSGNGAVRLLRCDRRRRAMLLERAQPGTDISQLPEDEAAAIALEVGRRLWQPAAEPFGWIGERVPAWLDETERSGRAGSGLVPLARDLYVSLDVGRGVVVHGDLHHHNIVDAGDRYVAIDPKPMLGEPEFDVPPFLWNPMPFEMHIDTTERRLAAFAAAGLDDRRMRAWAVIRGAYLGADEHREQVLRELVRGWF